LVRNFQPKVVSFKEKKARNVKKKGKRKSKSGIAGKGRRQNTTWHRANIISAISVFFIFSRFSETDGRKRSRKTTKNKKKKKKYTFFSKKLEFLFSVSKK